MGDTVEDWIENSLPDRLPLIWIVPVGPVPAFLRVTWRVACWPTVTAPKSTGSGLTTSWERGAEEGGEKPRTVIRTVPEFGSWKSMYRSLNVSVSVGWKVKDQVVEWPGAMGGTDEDWIVNSEAGRFPVMSIVPVDEGDSTEGMLVSVTLRVACLPTFTSPKSMTPGLTSRREIAP